jgi:serine/threonine protein kinase
LGHLEFMHRRKIVHRDIKPANIVIAYRNPEDTADKWVQERQCVYLVDFGLSKPYVYLDENNVYHHIPQKKHGGHTGTAYYMGVDAHRGSEASRRDDLQALAHMLLHCYYGKLPWSKAAHDYNKEKKRLEKDREREDNSRLHESTESRLKDEFNAYLLRKKRTTSADNLCPGLPAVYRDFVDYAKHLSFQETPNYRHWIEQFQQVLTAHTWDIETTPFDWCIDEVLLEQEAAADLRAQQAALAAQQQQQHGGNNHRRTTYHNNNNNNNNNHCHDMEGGNSGTNREDNAYSDAEGYMPHIDDCQGDLVPEEEELLAMSNTMVPGGEQNWSLLKKLQSTLRCY